MRSVHSALQAVLAELKLGLRDWASMEPAIATALNEASMDRLGYCSDHVIRSPLKVMVGITPKHQVLRVVPLETDCTDMEIIDKAPIA